MQTSPTYTRSELEAAVVAILGDEADQHRRTGSGEMFWGDALLHCAEHSFVERRDEDEASEMVRHAIGQLDEDFELPESLK